MTAAIPYWEDPRVDVIVNHWLDEDDGHGDPSWPDVAGKTLRALEVAGYRIVHPESSHDDCPDWWTCCIHNSKRVYQ